MNILIACFSQTGDTAKVHTRNIYGKLGVNNRTQAVAQARALGILPSILIVQMPETGLGSTQRQQNLAG